MKRHSLKIVSVVWEIEASYGDCWYHILRLGDTYILGVHCFEWFVLMRLLNVYIKTWLVQRIHKRPYKILHFLSLQPYTDASMVIDPNYNIGNLAYPGWCDKSLPLPEGMCWSCRWTGTLGLSWMLQWNIGPAKRYVQILAKDEYTTVTNWLILGVANETLTQTRVMRRSLQPLARGGWGAILKYSIKIPHQNIIWINVYPSRKKLYTFQSYLLILQ